MRTPRLLLPALLLAGSLFTTSTAAAGAMTPAEKSERLAALAADASDAAAKQPAGDDDSHPAQTGGTGDPRGDALDARGDLLSVAASNATDGPGIGLGVEVAQADTYSSVPWATGLTGIVWAIDLDRDADPEFGATVVSDGRPYVSVMRADGTEVCTGVAEVSGTIYSVAFADACIGAPSSFTVAAYMAYDTSPSCGTCPVSEDVTDFTAPIARGSSTATPAPAPAPTGTGYWFVAADGGIFSYGRPFHGSAAGRSDAPVVGMAAHPTRSGYWVVNANGRVFAYGGAGFHGDLAGKQLNQPVVDIAATPSGNGYYLLGKDGGIFTFGDAPFHGSTGNLRLNQPVVGMAASNR